MIYNRFKNNYFLKKNQKIINDINLLEDNLKVLNDSDLLIENFKLQKEYQITKNLNSLIVKSFALTREASKRTIGLRHFDVQLLGGLVLNSNQVAEMRTGEGKTLVATLAAGLNALTKKGVHIVTVNDYLANRDQVSMGQIYRFLGFETGLIQENMDQDERHKNYLTDITYVTNHELTFDYLRDNTVLDVADTVLRPFNYCIIDEIDSILIDEAQTPIILAATINDTNADKYIAAAEVINYLKLNQHYIVDEKNKNVILTDLGNRLTEKILEKDSLYTLNDQWSQFILNALKAKTLYNNNINYIIQDQRIVIVDEFTGRVMPDRRWSEGLHQAIEAKEKLPIYPRTEVRASVTYQNFFLMYPKLSGMTGTAITSAIEFKEIYNLPVKIIPTYKPIKRIDLPDLVYKNQFAKWNAIAYSCKQLSKSGQPILIGTATIEKSDMLAELLNEYKLNYQILNAKLENIRRESQIVAQAGKKTAITIATNMAGRGTDIILGGNVNFQIQKDLFNLLVLIKRSKRELNNFQQTNSCDLKHKIIKTLKNYKIFKKTIGCSQKFYSVLLSLIMNSNFSILSNVDILRILRENDRVATPKLKYQCSIRFLLNELAFVNKKYQFQESQIVKNIGGLYVIGTERNGSRRVDNQLIGRCGRQGDPGTSQFFLSFDDSLFRLFGGERLKQFVGNTMDELPVESNSINESLIAAQERLEEKVYEQRKILFDYDSPLTQQRNLIYYERQFLVKKKLIRNNNYIFGEQSILKIFSKAFKRIKFLPDSLDTFENWSGRNQEIYDLNEFYLQWRKFKKQELKNFYFQQFWLMYQIKTNEMILYGSDSYTKIEREITLYTLDKFWKQHLEKLSLLRDAVNWRGYGQKNPLTEYKREAYSYFLYQYSTLNYILMYDLVRSIIL